MMDEKPSISISRLRLDHDMMPHLRDVTFIELMMYLTDDHSPINLDRDSHFR